MSLRNSSQNLQKNQRTQSLSQSQSKLNRLASVQLPRNRHCKDDKACQHCCQCWTKHKKQYQQRIKIFKINIEKLQTQNNLLKNSLSRKTQQCIQLNKKVKHTIDLEFIKQQLRLQLQEQIDEQVRMKNILQRQKISELKEIIQEKNAAIQRGAIALIQLKEDLHKKSLKIEELQSQIESLTEEVEQKKIIQRKLCNAQATIKILSERLDTIQANLKSKQQVIDKLNHVVRKSDRLITEQIQSVNDQRSQKQVLTLKTKNKDQIIQKMTSATNETRKSLDLVSSQKYRLTSLVDSLVSELQQNAKCQTYLSLALNEAEYMAKQKSISLQNLKQDVNLLKYTL